VQHPIHGSVVALPTPFRAGQIDRAAFVADVRRHARAATQAIVVAGTTGESATLSEAERLELFALAVEAAGGALPVVAGVGTNDTRVTLRLARGAARAGVSGLLVVTPYYNRPSERGLLAHFGAVAEACPRTPIVLYNVPSRTACDLRPALAAELHARHANVVALKEATVSQARIDDLAATRVPLLAGDDSMLVPFLRAGAIGAVSVVGNVLPDETAALVAAGRADADDPRVRELEALLVPLIRALFSDTNPVPVKAALAELGDYPAEVRAPLVELEEPLRLRLREALRALHARPLPVGGAG
jgi:4-hydroxy-tetrahydrodipicolinate synthase